MQKNKLVDLLIGCLILIAVAKLRWNYGIANDITLQDETIYMYSGYRLPEFGLPPIESQPLYSLWYWGLSHFSSNSMGLYFLNKRVLDLAIPLILYFTVRSLHVNRTISAIGTLLCLNTTLFGMMPWPTYLVGLILLIGILVSSRIPYLFDFLLFATAVFLISALVRPEYYLAFVVSSFTGIALGCLISLSRKSRHLEGDEVRSEPTGFKSKLFYWALAGTFLGAVLLALKFGLPFTSGSRSLMAFGQHFSLNMHNQGRFEGNPWANYQTIVETYFGTISSVGEALTRNPGMFFWHIAQNVKTLLTITFYNLLYPQFIPSPLLNLLVRSVLWSFLIIPLLTLPIWVWTWFRQLYREGIWAALKLTPAFRTGYFLGLTLWVTLPALLVIYPREHYLIPTVLLWFCGASILWQGLIQTLFSNFNLSWGNINHSTGKYLPYTSLILIGFLVTITPALHAPKDCSFPAPCFWNQDVRIPRGQPNKAVVRVFRRMRVPASVPVNILEAKGGYHSYLTRNFHRVSEVEKPLEQPFVDFIKQRNVNAVVLEKLLVQDPRFTQDVDFKKFIFNPEPYGFVNYSVVRLPRKSPPSDHIYVYIRQDLLNVLPPLPQP